MPPSDLTVVPLGGDCFPRLCSVNVGLKNIRKNGEPSFPLDFGIWPVRMVRYLAENDFEGMADPANLMVRDSNGSPILCDRRYPETSYAHEMPPATDLDFTGDEFRLFRHRYDARIANLRGCLEQADKVLLFMTVTNLLPNPFSYQDFEAILGSFRERYPNAQFRLISVIEVPQLQVLNSWNQQIYVMNIPLLVPWTGVWPILQGAMVIHNAFGQVLDSFN